MAKKIETMTIKQAQKMVRGEDQKGILSLLWSKRRNKDKSMRLKNIAEKIGKPPSTIKNAMDVLTAPDLEIAVKVCRGVYQISDKVTV